MSRRLILVLALAFVVGISVAAYAEVQNVKVSGDINVLGIMRQIDIDHGNQVAGAADANREQSIATITRVKVDADLTDNVMATVRLLNERYWGTEAENSGDDDNTNIQLDLAYVTLKEFLYSPLTLRVGRQELRFGNAMIIGDPDTNNAVSTASAFSNLDADLSARKSFDAIRATLDYDPLTIDILTAKITENDLQTQDDVDLYGVHANYKLTDVTTLQGYYFGRYANRENLEPTTGHPNKPDRIDTIGARIVTSPAEKLTYQIEAAYQFGKANAYSDGTVISNDDMVDRRAWAVETALTMDMNDRKYAPSITGLYAYFTGQKGSDTAHLRAWNPMFEDQKYGDIANAQFQQTNAHIAGLIGTMRPTDDITLVGEYYAYWWDKRFGDQQPIVTVRGNNAIMENNKFAGQELDLRAIYDYTEDVQFSLLSGIFFPGGSFAEPSDNIATEVIGSMKVTF